MRRRRLRAPSSAEHDSASETRARYKEAAPLPSPSPETAIPPHVPRTRFCLTDIRLGRELKRERHRFQTLLRWARSSARSGTRRRERLRPPLSRGPDCKSWANLTRRTHFHRSDAHLRAAANTPTTPLPALFPRAEAAASEPDMIKVIHRFIFALFSHV